MCLAPQRRAICRQFFDICTSKSGPRVSVFYDFDLKMCFSPQRRAIFRHRNFKKWSAHDMFCTFWLENVLLATAACNFSTSQLQKVVRTWHVLYILTSKFASRYSGVQFFLCPLQSYLRTRRFSEVTFRPSRHTKHWKTQHFATSLTFRACWSSFFPHLLIFFLAALLFQLSILSEVRLLNFLRLWYIYSCLVLIYVFSLIFLRFQCQALPCCAAPVVGNRRSHWCGAYWRQIRIRRAWDGWNLLRLRNGWEPVRYDFK